MGVSPAQLALGKALGQIPTIQWPIQLTAKASFHLGMAALVFAGPTVLSPADDLAEFGYANPDQESASEDGDWFFAPYDGARAVAWFRPPQTGRKYNVDFACAAGWGGPFTLETSDGSSETVAVPTDFQHEAYETVTEHIGSTFEAGTHDWYWFALSCPSYWRLSYCEFNMLP